MVSDGVKLFHETGIPWTRSMGQCKKDVAIELRLSCTNPSRCEVLDLWHHHPITEPRQFPVSADGLEASDERSQGINRLGVNLVYIVQLRTCFCPYKT